MTSTITAHGYTFNVETQGFKYANTQADKERGIDAAEDALRAMPAAEVAALHAADLKWVTGGCADERPAGLDRIEAAAEAEATRGWHNASDAFISISAEP